MLMKKDWIINTVSKFFKVLRNHNTIFYSRFCPFIKFHLPQRCVYCTPFIPNFDLLFTTKVHFFEKPSTHFFKIFFDYLAQFRKDRNRSVIWLIVDLSLCEQRNKCALSPRRRKQLLQNSFITKFDYQSSNCCFNCFWKNILLILRPSCVFLLIILSITVQASIGFVLLKYIKNVTEFNLLKIVDSLMRFEFAPRELKSLFISSKVGLCDIFWFVSATVIRLFIIR